MGGYLIIGNGVAGTTAAENIRKIDEKSDIRIITDEDVPFYYRVRLNEFISGEIDQQDLVVKSPQWYEKHNITLMLKTSIVGSDDGDKAVLNKDGEKVYYDRLLIATGSHSFIPPIIGSEKKGVFTLRSIQDARVIAAYAKGIDEVVLIGGGLLGLEAGNALRKQGKHVTVVEFFPRLLPRQLDVAGAKRLESVMTEMGFTFRLGAKTQEISGDKQVEGVFLEGGERLPAKMVIISAGVRPNIDLAKSLGIDYDKGIKVDKHLKTNQPDIYAAGDVAEFRGMPYGIWPAAMEQGKIAGVNIAGGDIVYEGTTMSNTLKVVGIDLASAGNIDAENEYESRIVNNDDIYKKLVIDNNHIIGCIMLGDTNAFSKITKAMSENKDVNQINDVIREAGFGIK